VGGVGVWGHSLRSTFHRLHLLRLWTPTIFNFFLNFLNFKIVKLNVQKKYFTLKLFFLTE
jgi:hypothetical protein